VLSTRRVAKAPSRAKFFVLLHLTNEKDLLRQLSIERARNGEIRLPDRVAVELNWKSVPMFYGGSGFPTWPKCFAASCLRQHHHGCTSAARSNFPASTKKARSAVRRDATFSLFSRSAFALTISAAWILHYYPMTWNEFARTCSALPIV
jgi:hypothetical protein